MSDALKLLTTRRSFKAIDLASPAPSAAEIETLRPSVAGQITASSHLGVSSCSKVRRATPRRRHRAAFRAKYPDAKLEHVETERKRLARAPLVVAVVSRASPDVKIPEWEQVLSGGAAAMNLLLAAHALGYGASWITEWYAYDRSVLDALGLAPHERIIGFIHIGRPPGPPRGSAASTAQHDCYPLLRLTQRLFTARPALPQEPAASF